jgi:hypothetical protein
MIKMWATILLTLRKIKNLAVLNRKAFDFSERRQSKKSDLIYNDL